MTLLPIAFAIISLLTSCSHFDEGELYCNSDNKIYISFENESRVQLSNNQTVWTAGDEVSIFYRTTGNERWRFNGATGDTEGSLSKVSSASGSATSSIVAVYPYNKSYTLSGSNLSATIVSSQTYADNSYGLGANMMVATSGSDNLSLKNVFGYLCLRLSGNCSVKSIVLSGNNNEKLAGSATINTTTTSLSFKSSATKSLTLNCNTGVQLSSTPTDFYIAVAPQTFTKGISITITCADGTTVNKSTSKAITIARNHIVPMANISIGQDNVPASYKKSWSELPKYVANNNYIYNTHTATLQNAVKRNYTYCFDKTLHAAHWVAYPLHSCYTSGSASRSNVFEYDPLVSTSYQANMSRSYTGSYDRGHQIAAADRKSVQEMQDQTFYATNMTPQYSNFNQKLWAAVESKVRNQICADTLYVVTGAYFGGPYDSSIQQSTTDTDGKTMPIPSHYYKVLLRTSSGNTGKGIETFKTASSLRAIGIWLQHSNTGSSTAIPSTAFVSVKEIEAITGFTFFDKIDASIADEVKSQCSPSSWSGLQ